MTTIALLKITPEAKIWRDLDPEGIVLERRIRIGCAIAGALVLIGMALGIYFSVSSPVAISFSALQMSIGGGLLIGGPLILTAIFFNLEKYQNGYLREPNFAKDNKMRKKHYNILTKSGFTDIYDAYYRNGFGLGPLVRQGLLTVEDGNTLRTYFKRMKESCDIEGKNKWANRKKGVRLGDLQGGWVEYQKQLSIIPKPTDD